MVHVYHHQADMKVQYPFSTQIFVFSIKRLSDHSNNPASFPFHLHLMVKPPCCEPFAKTSGNISDLFGLWGRCCCVSPSITCFPSGLMTSEQYAVSGSRVKSTACSLILFILISGSSSTSSSNLSFSRVTAPLTVSKDSSLWTPMSVRCLSKGEHEVGKLWRKCWWSSDRDSCSSWLLLLSSSATSIYRSVRRPPAFCFVALNLSSITSTSSACFLWMESHQVGEDLHIGFFLFLSFINWVFNFDYLLRRWFDHLLNICHRLIFFFFAITAPFSSSSETTLWPLWLVLKHKAQILFMPAGQSYSTLLLSYCASCTSCHRDCSQGLIMCGSWD